MFHTVNLSFDEVVSFDGSAKVDHTTSPLLNEATSPNETTLEVSALFHSVERFHLVRLICFIW